MSRLTEIPQSNKQKNAEKKRERERKKRGKGKRKRRRQAEDKITSEDGNKQLICLYLWGLDSRQTLKSFDEKEKKSMWEVP